MHLPISFRWTQLLFLAFSFVSVQVAWAQEATRPFGTTPYREEEYPTGTYTPNMYHNQLTSPGYRKVTQASNKVQSTLVTTVQVNVNGQQQNIIGDAANEPNLLVNPLNANEMAMGWRQFDDVNNDFRQAGWATTSDGGQHWNFHGVIQPGIFRSDPVLDVNADGEFYYNSLTKDSVGNYLCQVFKSTDQGNSWGPAEEIGGGDKQWMAIDRSAGVGDGNIYSVWTTSYSYCQPGQFTRSTNGGASYESCTMVNGDPYWTSMTVGNNGELYIAGASSQFGGFVVSKSVNVMNAGSMFGWNPVIVNMNGSLGGWSPINPVGLIGQANIDVDRSNGPGRDNVYVLASMTSATGQDTADVMFARSTDGGQSWSTPIRVNDDPASVYFQWLGTMSVAPNGRIDAIWLDNRDGNGSHASALYYSYSTDQGTTWSANEKLSDSFDPHLGYPLQQKMGDYFDMVSDNGGAHLAWANTLNGEQDVYYSHIVPAVSVGMPAPTETVSMTIAPNPNAGILQVRSSAGPARVRVTNLWGTLLFESDEYLPSRTIDITAWPSGVYFLEAELGNGQKETHKIIRE